MSLHSPILETHIRDYIVSKSHKEHPVLERIRIENINHPEAFIQIPPEQAKLISLLIKMINAKKVLELGVFLGYSALSITLGLPENGKLIACEINQEYATKALQYLQDAGMAHKIDMKIGPALNTLTNLITSGHTGTFDFVFIDADKNNYQEYYELSLKLVRVGGVIAIDNVLWYGRIFDKLDDSKLTETIRNLNEQLSKDERIDVIIIPIGDGMSLIIKK